MRNDEYRRGLDDLHPSDFELACDIIQWQDEWFPTIARIREVSAECLRERMARHDAQQRTAAARMDGLVCATCHGARHVRLGGASPVRGSHAGFGWQSGDRGQPCPDCTTDGRYDAGKERATIRREHGVLDPSGNREPDMNQSAWRVPRTVDGRVDMQALYVESRILRGLDPLTDDRPRSVPGFTTPATALTGSPR